ncbi:MAG: ABC transporter permease, partial [Anaerolineae bacterium]
EEMLREPPVVTTVTVAASASATTADGFAQTSPGQLVTWVMLTLVGAAEVLVNERLAGTLRRLLVTPTRRATILTGKVVGRLILGLVQMALLIGFGAFVLGVDWGRSPLALLLIIGAFALASVAFGILLATIARSRNQAGWLGVFFTMLMAALGGAWWPIEITPPLYQSVVRVFPTTWAMRGFTDVIVRGQGVSGIYVEVLVLLGFAVVFFAAGIRRFRFE